MRLPGTSLSWVCYGERLHLLPGLRLLCSGQVSAHGSFLDRTLLSCENQRPTCRADPIQILPQYTTVLIHVSSVRWKEMGAQAHVPSSHLPKGQVTWALGTELCWAGSSH